MLAGLAYSAIAAAAFPPVNLWPLALVAPVPLLWAAGSCRPRWAVGGGRGGSGGGGGGTPRGSTWPPLIAGLLVALGSLPLWFFEERWVIDVTLPGYPGLALYMAMWTGLSVAVTAWLLKYGPRTRWWTIGLAEAGAIGIVGCELLRGEVVLTGYAWFLSAQPLIELPILAAPAALLGTYFVSLLVCALAGALGDAMGWSPRSRAAGSAAGLVVVVAWIVTAVAGRAAVDAVYAFDGSERQPGGEEVTIGVVQTNLPQDNKKAWDDERRRAEWKLWADLTRQAARTRPVPDLIVWPETMYPGGYLNDEAVSFFRDNAELMAESAQRVPSYFGELLALQKQIERPMLIGAIAAEGWGLNEARRVFEAKREYNSVFLVTEGRVDAQRYDKVELTPFGEVMPYVWRWPGLQQKLLDLGAAGMAFDLASGERYEPIRVTLARSADDEDEDKAVRPGAPSAGDDDEDEPMVLAVATPICFEATKARHVARLVTDEGGGRRTAQLIVNLSNDGWFNWATGCREQHLLAARWRCVELGTPMVRAVNTGVSASIDVRGRVRKAGIDRTKESDASGGKNGEEGQTLTGVAGFMIAQVRAPSLDAPVPPYARLRALVPVLVGAAAAGVVGVGTLSRLRRRRRA